MESGVRVWWHKGNTRWRKTPPPSVFELGEEERHPWAELGFKRDRGSDGTTGVTHRWWEDVHINNPHQSVEQIMSRVHLKSNYPHYCQQLMHVNDAWNSPTFFFLSGLQLHCGFRGGRVQWRDAATRWRERTGEGPWWCDWIKVKKGRRKVSLVLIGSRWSRFGEIHSPSPGDCCKWNNTKNCVKKTHSKAIKFSTSA